MKRIFLLTVLASLVIVSCSKKQGPEGKKSLIDLITEDAGENCPSGGYKVVSGIDLNDNNNLDASEIQDTKFICNGAKGNNSLVSLVPEAAGANCSAGGYKITTGIDINNDNILGVNEVQNTQYVCNGVVGNNSLVALASEPAGANCNNGGYKVNTGTDTNKNGILDQGEIQNTSYICNGNDGLNFLVSVKSEAAGYNCRYGGYSFNSGIDVNKNGILDVNEITKTDFVCNTATINEIRLPLEFYGTTTEMTGIYGPALYNFNKNNYPGLDSIVLSTGVFSESSLNFTKVELINMVDTSTIEGSLLTSNLSRNNAPIQYSANLYNSLPNGPINIGLRIKSGKQGSTSGTTGQPYLILYQKGDQ